MVISRLEVIPGYTSFYPETYSIYNTLSVYKVCLTDKHSVYTGYF